MALLKLLPSYKDYLWGGHRLVEEYHKQYDGEILAESWELSCHPDGPSYIQNGSYAGKTLEEYIEAEGRDVLGNNCRRFKDFPILIKFIDARDNLSIQVHPDNRYAGKDIVIAEIQQNSNVTYRVYDYGRVGKDGKKRDLHIEKALQVTSRVPILKSKTCNPHVASCDYFTVDKLNLDGSVMKKMTGFINKDSFASILFMEGEGTIRCGEEVLKFQKGDSFFLSAGSGDYEVNGTCEALVTTIGEKASPVRIGIDIGGTDTKIGLVDVNQKLLVQKTIPTGAGRPWQEVIRDIGEGTCTLLEKYEIPMDKCVGAGIGVPGTVDRENGVVKYSNNIRWEDVPLAQEMGKYLPIPIYVANDADCAVLGETAGGAAQHYQDVIMLTLGTGVGGGIVLDGKIYAGKLSGGSELGHTVIVEDGELCT